MRTCSCGIGIRVGPIQRKSLGAMRGHRTLQMGDRDRMDLQTSLLALREHAKKHDIGFLVRGQMPHSTSEIDACIQQIIDADHMGKSLSIPTNMLVYMDSIHDQLRKAGLADSEIQAYSSRFDDFASVTVLSVLALVFELDIGFSWAPGLVGSKCPDLEFDDDGLLVGPLDKIDFVDPRKLVPIKGRQPVDFSFGSQKVGIAYKNSYIIPFHYSIGRYNLGLSDGFLRFMSNFVAEHSTVTVGVKVSDDTLLDMSSYRDSITKAYIRGPKGISPTKLQSESFPEDSRGDVTEHRRIEDDSEILLSERLFPTEGFQVMWSRKGPLKTCQAEEIVRPNNTRATEGDLVYNRYIHAIWTPLDASFAISTGALEAMWSRIMARESLQT